MMSEGMKRVDLDETHIFGGKRYGPGRGVEVPQDMIVHGKQDQPMDGEVDSDLPEDFPKRDAFIAAGVTTLAKLRAAKDEDLLGIHGIGTASLTEARDAAEELGE